MSPVPVGILASAHAVTGSAYAAAVLADSPGLYWRLGETTGVFADSSGNGRDGTAQGGVFRGNTSLVAGDADPSVINSNNGASAIAYAAWQDATTFTAEAIIKPATPTSSYRCVISADGAAGRFWNFYVLDGQLHIYNDTTPVLTGPTTLTTGTNYHIAMTADGSGTKLYLNGVLNASAGTPLAAATGTSGREFVVGASPAGIGGRYFPFAGYIDEVAWYPTALSAARLLAHANAAGY